MTRPLLAIRAVDPIGTRTAHGFACRADGTVINEWTEKVYPPSPCGERLRRVRVDLGVGLRDAARVLELRADVLSALEVGRATFAKDESWAWCEAALMAHAEGKSR